jgi:type I restriction enzyme, R subunit
MNVHKEISFEDEICAHLATHRWLYADGDAAKYDRARALFPPDLIEWLKASQPKAWEAFSRSGSEAMLLDRVRKQIEQRGTLDVLRHGVEMIGVRGALKLAEFKPALPRIPRSSRATRRTICGWSGRFVTP